MNNATLNEKFFRQTSETEGTIDAYSDRLDRVVASCPEANVVLESQQWSQLAAIQIGGTIFEADQFVGDSLPFDPSDIAVQVAYFWDRKNEQWDLAWVATFPWE